MLYIPHKITVADNQTSKLKQAIASQSKKVTIKFRKEDIQKLPAGDHTLLLTSRQIVKLQKAQRDGKSCTIILRQKQIHANIEHEGGFLSLLASLAARLLPQAIPLLGGLATGLISGGVEKAIKGSGYFLHKKNEWYKLRPTKGKGLYLSRHPRFPGTYGDGLFMKRGNQIQSGAGFLLGPNSPFKNIPLLNLIL